MSHGKPMPPLPPLNPCPRCGSGAVPVTQPARICCESWDCQFVGPKRQRILDAAEAWNLLERPDSAAANAKGMEGAR